MKEEKASLCTGCYGLNVCAPSSSYVEGLTPIVTVFGHRAHKGVIKAKCGCQGGALIKQDWCPREKRKRDPGSLSTRAPRNNHNRKAAVYEPEGEFSPKTEFPGTLIMDF